MGKPDHIELNEREIDFLLERVSACNLEGSDKQLLTRIIQFYLWLQWALQETKLSVQRLRSLFGFRRTEKRNHLDAPSVLGEVALPTGATPNPEAIVNSLSPEKTNKGHGRLGHEDYPGATTVEHKHATLKPGDSCPERCGGRLYSIKPKVVINITGHALASATKHLLERLRCALCGKVFTAALEEGMSSQKYDEALKAHLTIVKNYAGMPFYRTAMLQDMVGVPLPDATQWELVESLADDIYPVYYALERLAAQGQIIHHDDIVVRILSLLKENREKSSNERRGMYTTGIVSKVDEHMIYLFIASRCHSGENMTKLLAQRSSHLSPVIRMADALSCNLSTEFIEILCHCLSDGRRKFYEIYDYFPGECRVVIDTLALVYHHDALSKQEKMDARARLTYHQTHSALILDKLKDWMTEQLEEKHVESNNSLGKAFKYMLNHWEKLTRFLYVAGAPLDNNITERALKIPIRSRKNSLFYKTEHGAFVGSMLTSIIHTCVMAKENPVSYLTNLQKNKSALFKAPQDWLPWNYHKAMQAPQLQAA